MATELTKLHRVLIYVEVTAADDEDEIMAQVGRMFTHPLPLGNRVTGMSYMGLAETAETRASEDELHRSYTEPALKAKRTRRHS